MQLNVWIPNIQTQVYSFKIYYSQIKYTLEKYALLLFNKGSFDRILIFWWTAPLKPHASLYNCS